ncbi:guanylate kinase [Clostridium tarantellae]|uniref:Guanylate kinase n=1 Tax=Clostridium tarantellae TaxID=39493 RepID=A0A6I1MN44_9CLOT|nr:guanylate kinase [Clostridium tarantellae]MPQ42341.1 guanylate kinase [Clostridium tarantellae]
MGKIFCILGKSGSGKDTIFGHLKRDKDLNLLPIIGYTTRPMRKNETHGIEYFFITNNELENYKNLRKIIEVRSYDTVNGKWYYGTIDDGQIELNKNNYLFISTLEAYKSLIKYFGKNNIIPIYINLDDGVRLERALVREKKQINPNFNELCRRFLADDIDFSYNNLKECRINKFYENYDLHECLEEIKKDIKKYL